MFIKRIQKVSYLGIFAISSLFSADIQMIQRPAFFAPSHLGDIELSHDGEQFYVSRNTQRYVVEKHLTDSDLRNINAAQLRAFLEHGHIEITKMDDVDEFTLRARVHALGGGPLTAWLLYSATKTVCYGGAAAAVGTAAVATAGSVAATLGGSALVTAGTNAAAGLAGYAASGSALGTAMATGGSTAVAAAITSSAAATELATLATAGTLGAAGGCIATAMAAVETASLGAFAVGMWLPLP